MGHEERERFIVQMELEQAKVQLASMDWRLWLTTVQLQKYAQVCAREDNPSSVTLVQEYVPPTLVQE